MSETTERDAPRRAPFLQRLTGPALVSWPVLAVITAWSAVLALLGGGAAVSGSPALRAGMGAVSGVAAFVVVAAIWALVINKTTGGVRVLLTALVVLLAGVVRGVVMQWGLTAVDFVDSTTATLATRIANGVATIPIAFVIAAAAVSALRSYRDTATALVLEQARLLRLLEDSTRVIEERQADAIARVRARLDEAIRELPLDSGPSAVTALETLAGDVVRPLSHSLARDLPAWEVDGASEVPRVRWIDVWRRPDPRVAIQPLLLGAACLVVAVPASFLLLTPRSGIPAVIAAVGVLTVTLVIGRWALRRMPPTPALVAWAAISSVLLAAAALVAVTVTVVARDDPSVGVFVGPGVFAIVTFGLLIATASMMRVRMAESTALLEDATRQLRWTLARVNTQQWEQAGRLSRALHGPVQSLIHARVQRLRQQAADPSTPLDVRHLRAELQQALASALTPQDAARDLPELFNELAGTWSGVADIDWHVVAPARERLQADSLCALAISDLAVEAVSNAVRHGRARRVDIAISVEGGDLAVLRVVDDGVRGKQSTPGLGTTLLTQCTVDWSLSATAPTTLSARLPLGGTPA